MTVLSAQSIQLRINPKEGMQYSEGKVVHVWAENRLEIEPFEPEAKQVFGMSYGLTAAGYDIRLGQIRHPRRGNEIVETCTLRPGEFLLAASFERVKIPNDLQVIVHDKSSWARKGLALQNTVLEPGWEGYITLELSNHGDKTIALHKGQPIAQLVFHQLDQPTTIPYDGKYQNQSAAPQESIYQEDRL